MITKVKDPEATRTYKIDWSDYLQNLGNVTIAASEWTVPEGLEVISDTNDETGASIKLGGGTVNVNYTIYNKITTSGGDTDRRAILIQIRDAATFNEASDLEDQLAAVRAVMTNSATKNQYEYMIAGRRLRRYTMQELLALEARLTTLVRESRMTNALRNGAPFLKNVQTRFLR